MNAPAEPTAAGPVAARRWLAVALLAVALATGVMLVLQRAAATQLREEIALLREESRELARVRDENARLRATQLPPAELERLRADHAAVLRLRREIEEMKSRLDRRP